MYNENGQKNGRKKSEQTIKWCEQIEATYKLDKENAELKEKNLSYKDAVDMQMYTNRANKEIADKQLTKAKFLLKQLVDAFPKSYSDVVKDTLKQAEQFLSEVE